MRGRRESFFLLSAVVVSLLLLAHQETSAGPLRFTLLHTNDLHSHFEGLGPDGAVTPTPGDGDPVIGHFARLASLILETKSRKAGQGEPVLLFDSGDAQFGTLFQILGPSPRTPVVPELQFFSDMGYDAICLGNHDFEAGEHGLAVMLNKAAAAGISLPILGTNLRIHSRNEELARFLQPLAVVASGPRFLPFWLKALNFPERTLRIGVIGLFGTNAAQVSMAIRHDVSFDGFDDRTTRSDFDQLVTVAARAVAELRGKYAADLVIALFHGGIPEDVRLARKVPGLDIILSGHTQDPYFLQQNGVFIHHSGFGGATLGRLELSWEEGRLSLLNPEKTLVPVDDSGPADPSTWEKTQGYKEIVDRLLSSGTYAYSTPIFETEKDFQRMRFPDNRAGVLAASCLESEINRYLQPPIDVFISSYGMIRSEFRVLGGRPTAYQYSDVFKFFPLGYDARSRPGSPLVTFYLTKKDLRILLEVMEAFGKVTPSYEPVTSDSLVYEVNPLGIPMLNRIINPRLHDLEFPEWPYLVRVGANDFFFRNLRKVRELTNGMIRISPRNSSGLEVEEPIELDIPREADLLAASLSRIRKIGK